MQPDDLPKQETGGVYPEVSCSILTQRLPPPLCREEGEIVIEGHPDDETKWIPHAQFLEILSEINHAAQCVGGPDIIRAGITRYLKTNS